MLYVNFNVKKNINPTQVKSMDIFDVYLIVYQLTNETKHHQFGHEVSSSSDTAKIVILFYKSVEIDEHNTHNYFAFTAKYPKSSVEIPRKQHPICIVVMRLNNWFIEVISVISK